LASTLCFFCGRETQATAGDPGLWPIYLGFPGGNGASRCYCTHCVILRLESRDRAVRSAKQYDVILEATKDAESVGAQAAITWALTHYDNWLHGAYDERDLEPTLEEEAADAGRAFGTHLAEAIGVIRSIFRRRNGQSSEKSKR
jgi:hypothetical protein